MKEILVTNGTTGFGGRTNSETEEEHIEAARLLWPFVRPNRVTIKVTEDDEVVYEEKVDL